MANERELFIDLDNGTASILINVENSDAQTGTSKLVVTEFNSFKKQEYPENADNEGLYDIPPCVKKLPGNKQRLKIKFSADEDSIFGRLIGADKLREAKMLREENEQLKQDRANLQEELKRLQSTESMRNAANEMSKIKRPNPLGNFYKPNPFNQVEDQ